MKSARRLIDRDIELYPDFSGVYYTKAWLNMIEGEYEEAAQMWFKAFEIDKVSTEVLDEHREAFNLYGIKGLFKVFLEFNLKRDPIFSYMVARDYYILGDYERSLDWFEHAIEERNLWMIQVNQDPLYSDPVFRSNPRFLTILKKMNFPEL